VKKRRTRIKPDETVSLQVSNRERLLILNETMIDALASPEIIRKVRFAVIEHGSIILHFTLEELDELAGYVAAAANHTENEAVEQELDQVCERIEGLLDAYTDEEEFSGDMHDGFSSDDSSYLEDLIQRALKDKQFGSAGDTNEYLSQVVDEYNRRPQGDMGGLSPIDVRRLLSSDWEGEHGAIILNTELKEADLLEAEIFQNARILLSAVHRNDGIKATVKGNLSRDFVLKMVNEMNWPKGFVDELWRYNKVLNEFDVGPLHIIRLVLQLSSLLRLAKGSFRATRKAEQLLEIERSGVLYALLFRTYFRKFNLSYLSVMPEVPALQHTIAFSFYMLSKHANTWRKLETLTPFSVLPVVSAQIYESRRSDAGIYFNWIILERIIRPLETFGLIEVRKGDSSGVLEIRKASLFEKFLRFDLSAS